MKIEINISEEKELEKQNRLVEALENLDKCINGSYPNLLGEDKLATAFDSNLLDQHHIQWRFL